MELTGEMALISLALAAGGFLKGATGAGAPVVAVPVLVLFFDVPFAVAVMVIPNAVSNLWQGWRHRASALPARFTWGFGLISAGGAVLGSAILAHSPPEALLVAVAAAVFGYIAFRLARPDWVLGYAGALRLLWPAGVASGILQAATGISAPVILSYFNAMRLKRETFIGSISVAFGLMSIVQVPTLLWYGILDSQRALYGTLAILPLLAAMPLGAWAIRYLPTKLFDRVILGLLALIALRMIWKSLGG